MKKIILGALTLFLLTFASSFSAQINIPESFVEISPGEMLYFEVDVKYPENLNRIDLRFNYEVSNLEGIVVKEVKGLKAMDTQISFLESFEIPDSVSEGLHLIKITIRDYETLERIIESSFHIISVAGDKFLMYLFIILGSFLLVGTLVTINIVILIKKK